MLQLEVAGVYLDLYNLDPPKLNFTIEDIRDTAPRSVFSRTFRVPATDKNTELFKTAFDVNGVDFDIRQRREARIYVGGILFRTGEVRLNKIYDTREGARIDYEIIFLGETKDFGTSLGERNLNELDLSEYTHVNDLTNVELSWQAYPEGSLTDGLFEGDILYPLIDFGNTYNDLGEPEQTMIQQDSTAGVPVFTKSNNFLPVKRMKPMIRVKAVIDAMFSEAGFTYTSNFFNSNRFKHLYLSAFNNTDNINTDGASNNMRVELSNNSTPASVVPFDNVIYDYGSNYNTSTYQYVVNTTGLITYDWRVYITATAGEFATGTLTARLTKNGTTTIQSDSYSFTGTQTFTLGGTTTNVGLNFDDIDIRLTDVDIDQYQIKSNSYFSVIDAPADVAIAPLLQQDYKQIDFFKDLLTKFRLVMVPNKNLLNDFIIEPWQEYIGSGDLFDWTEKLDLTKDFLIEPVFYTQSSRINFNDKDGQDYLNIINQDTFQEVFGTLKVNGDNEFLSGSRDIKTNIIPTPITQIKRKNTSIGQTFIIPQLHGQEPNDNSTYNPQHTPILANSRLLFYNGLKDTDGITWYLDNNSNSHTTYPMVSYYEDFVNTNNTLNLNWQGETGYIQHSINNGLFGKSVYDEYWASYINSLYDGYSRRVVAYFVLDESDLYNFSFDDVIFVKNAYYYVSKITDLVIGEKNSVKVELIKLVNYNVPISPTRPRRVWNTTYQDWQDAVFRWDM